jgi:integrase
MKIPEPKQMPSGKWLIQVMVDGKRVGKSFDTAKEAKYWASGIKTGMKQQSKSPRNMTVGEAIDKYIESKDAVLSPSTVAGYCRIRKNQLQGIMNIRLADLTQEKVQREINAMAKTKSPKTVHNAHGLLTATLADFYPELILRTTLPQKRRTDIVVPSESDIIAIAEAVKGKSIELPVMLAMWLGLRMSEIRGLTWDCVKGNIIHIKQALVDEGLKTTKTYNSDRVLPLPPYIKALIDAQPHNGEFIIPSSRRAIHSRFEYYIEKAGIQHYRFHDLRHVNASVMLALNVPDKYAMKRMGHATNNMLKTVYQHTMDEKEQQVNAAVDQYFESIIK